MDRRTLLSLLAGTSVGLAGCSNQSSDTPTGTPADTSTPPATDGPTEAPMDTPTEEPTETPTEAPEDTPTEEPTAEPTETPTREERARRAIEDASTALGEAVDAYEAAAGPNATLLSVDATVAFSIDRLEDPLRRAGNALDRAERVAPGEQAGRVRRLRRTLTWLRNLARAQSAAADAFEAYARLRDAVYAGEESTASTAASDLEPLVGPVDDHLDAATGSVEASDVTVVPALSESLFNDKNAQLRAAARTFDLLAEEGEPTASAIATFGAGTDAYADRERRQARNSFRDARDGLQTASSRLSGPDLSASTVGGQTADLGCACGVLSDAAETLRRSASAWMDGRPQRRDRLLEEAKGQLTGCGSTLDRIPVVERARNLNLE